MVRFHPFRRAGSHPPTTRPVGCAVLYTQVELTAHLTLKLSSRARFTFPDTGLTQVEPHSRHPKAHLLARWAFHISRLLILINIYSLPNARIYKLHKRKCLTF